MIHLLKHQAVSVLVVIAAIIRQLLMTCHQYSLLKRFKRENLERNKRTSAFDSAAAYDMSTILRYVEDKIYLIAHKHQLLAVLHISSVHTIENTI